MAQRVITMPFTLEGIDPALRTALRGLETVAINSVESIFDFNADIYENQTFDPKTITKPIFAGMTDAELWDGIEAITPGSMSYLYDVTATQYYYANGIAFTFDSLTFDLYGINPKLSREQMISAETKRQKVGAALFNNGFTTNWFDGVPFFSASHPLAESYDAATYNCNVVSGALAHDTLQDAIDYGTTMVDPMGRPLNSVPYELWVGPTQASLGEYLLNSGLKFKSGSAEYNKNPYDGIALKVYPWFTTATTWMVRFRRPAGRQCFCSKKIPLKMMAPKENNAHGYQRDMIFCEAYWSEDYTEWVGSTGA